RNRDLTRQTRLESCSSVDGSPVERDRERGECNTEDARQAQSLCERDRAHPCPDAPRPESKYEEVVALSSLVSQIAWHKLPPERRSCLEVQIHHHTERSADEQQEHSRPTAPIIAPVRSGANDPERRERDRDRDARYRGNDCRSERERKLPIRILKPVRE